MPARLRIEVTNRCGGLPVFMLGKGDGSVKVLKSNIKSVSFGTPEILVDGNGGGNLSNLLQQRSVRRVLHR